MTLRGIPSRLRTGVVDGVLADADFDVLERTSATRETSINTTPNASLDAPSQVGSVCPISHRRAPHNQAVIAQGPGGRYRVWCCQGR